MIGLDYKGVISKTYAVTGGGLPCDGNVGLIYFQGGLKLDQA